MDKSERGELSGNTSLPDIYTNEEKKYAVITRYLCSDDGTFHFRLQQYYLATNSCEIEITIYCDYRLS